MFAEKAALVDAFNTLDTVDYPLTVYRSSERAVEQGNSLPAVAIDIGSFSSVPYDEFGSVRAEVTPMMIVLFVAVDPSDDSVHEASAQVLHEKVQQATLALYPRAEMYGEPIGIREYGAGKAYVVAYTLQLDSQLRTY